MTDLPLVCGIDPGNKGALALTRGAQVVELFDMPVIVTRGKAKLVFREDGQPEKRVPERVDIDVIGVRDTLVIWRELYGEYRMVLEKVSSRPGQGIASTTKFVGGARAIYGIGLGMMLDVVHVRPEVWKAKLGVTADKSTAKVLAAQLFPTAKIRRADQAEALLISYYGTVA